jgi:hypothetical protein
MIDREPAGPHRPVEPVTGRGESKTGSLRCRCGFSGDWVAIATHGCTEGDPSTFAGHESPPNPPHGRDPADWPDSGVTY